ncbi:nucleotide pyrophosphohydrolase [Dissulfurispira thermophila]|uniref:Nucleotide pyrophosphohydrolase n=2 Tax=root TaxID=1 RepID=A0A7G1H1A7_9BACT|nr:nucleotide pyrophosphohydrolase [Dissulfurispira thermophila]BCB95766.1 nucleotide pyrophosphohydrolase [Dissulfurispira thermophila]
MQGLIQKLRHFAKERDWDKFHSPKNLAMSLSVEVSEIVELFQWMSEEESYNLNPEKLQRLKEEIGDVMIYLAKLADKFGIDPIDAAKEKIKINEKKYPVSKVKGKAKKYNEY